MELPVNYASLSSKEKREVRDEYYKKQDGKCIHCGNPLNGPPTKQTLKLKINLSLFPKNFLRYNNHLHHDHDTEMTIGVVHSYCNAVLWQYHRE